MTADQLSSPAFPLWAPDPVEVRFKVGSVVPDGDAVRAYMEIGPWTTWPDGEACLGSLGVVIDDALGTNVFLIRPPGADSVTAELSVDVVQPPPWPSGQLVAVSRLLADDQTGGLTAADVLDDRGALVAVATARCQFVPRPSASQPSASQLSVSQPSVSQPTSGSGPDVDPARRQAPADYRNVLDMLGARAEPGAESARIVVDDPTELGNGNGTVHGGVLFCGSELAATALRRGAAAPPSAASGATSEYTVSVRMHFLRPARLDEALTFTADVVHRGRSTTVSRVTSRGSSGKPCSIAIVTRRRSPAPSLR